MSNFMDKYGFNPESRQNNDIDDVSLLNSLSPSNLAELLKSILKMKSENDQEKIAISTLLRNISEILEEKNEILEEKNNDQEIIDKHYDKEGFPDKYRSGIQQNIDEYDDVER